MKHSGTSKAAVLERDLRFAQAFIAVRENATEAYLAVKPHVSRKTAGVEGHKLLKLPRIQAAIEKARAALRARYSLTTDRVVQELGRLSLFNPKRMVDANGRPIPLHQLDDDTAAALANVDITETTVTGKGKNQVVTTRTVKGRPFNKGTALNQAIKILRLYDKPPPPPPDPNSLDEVSRLEIARRVAFTLIQGARTAKQLAPMAPAKRRAKVS